MGPSAKARPLPRATRISCSWVRRRLRLTIGPGRSDSGALGQKPNHHATGVYYLFCVNLPSSDTVNLERPFLRRAASTLRPPLLAIRLRKPCSRRRGIRFGCHVRFIRPLLRKPGSRAEGKRCRRRPLNIGQFANTAQPTWCAITRSRAGSPLFYEASEADVNDSARFRPWERALKPVRTPARKSRILTARNAE